MPPRPPQADPAIEAAEADSNLLGILQGAVNVDWTSTADAPKVRESLCHGTTTSALPLLSPAMLACCNLDRFLVIDQLLCIFRSCNENGWQRLKHHCTSAASALF